MSRPPRPGRPTGSRPGWRNLGPRSRDWLALAGVHTPEQLHSIDALQLYLRVREFQPSAGLNLLYALIGAQEDRPWQEVARERRLELLLQLDALGAAPR